MKINNKYVGFRYLRQLPNYYRAIYNGKSYVYDTTYGWTKSVFCAEEIIISPDIYFVNNIPLSIPLFNKKDIE